MKKLADFLRSKITWTQEQLQEFLLKYVEWKYQDVVNEIQKEANPDCGSYVVKMRLFSKQGILNDFHKQSNMWGDVVDLVLEREERGEHTPYYDELLKRTEALNHHLDQNIEQIKIALIHKLEKQNFSVEIQKVPDLFDGLIGSYSWHIHVHWMEFSTKTEEPHSAAFGFDTPKKELPIMAAKTVKKTAKKATAKKKIVKKAAKKVVKKTKKKITKKKVPKVAKKIVKKSTKKKAPAKKIVKKSTKKKAPAKKVVKRAAKKVVKKIAKAPAKKTVKPVSKIAKIKNLALASKVSIKDLKLIVKDFLPDSDKSINLFSIKGSGSNNSYLVMQSKESGKWYCTAKFHPRFYNDKKTLSDLMPALLKLTGNAPLPAIYRKSPITVAQSKTKSGKKGK